MRAHTDEGPQVSKYTWYGVISAEKEGVKRRGERRQFRKVKCVEEGGVERSGGGLKEGEREGGNGQKKGESSRGSDVDVVEARHSLA